jgi:hypothetical protein
MEAHELASEAEKAIKASQKIIKAALRGLGAASDISEAGSLDIAPPPPPRDPPWETSQPHLHLRGWDHQERPLPRWGVMWLV